MEWHPIKTAPTRRDILVCATYSVGNDQDGGEIWHTDMWVDALMDGGGWFQMLGRDDLPYPPAHWMPLPEPPK